MPLAFQTESNESVAFGFFNIDTDLLLLQRRFFFADTLAWALEEVARGDHRERIEEIVPGWEIGDPATIGNLHGAIHGFDHSGFIGAVYRHFPFPDDPAAFKQRPEGATNRALVEGLLAEWAEPRENPLLVEPRGQAVELAGVRFDRAWFRDVVAYVWRGGMPRWKGERRPDYLEQMKRVILASDHPLFRNQNWEMELCRC